MKKNKRKLLEQDNLKLWALCVKKEAEYKCFLCGNKHEASALDAHHIFTKGSCTNLKYDLNNGVCLCKGCHRFKVHMHVCPILVPNLIARRGEEWMSDLLSKKVLPPIRRSISDLEDINVYLKEEFGC